MALIDAYTQNLTTRQLNRLLRRATFGATPAQLKIYADKKADEVVQQLLATQPVPPRSAVDTNRFYTYYPRQFGRRLTHRESTSFRPVRQKRRLSDRRI